MAGVANNNRMRLAGTTANICSSQRTMVKVSGLGFTVKVSGFGFRVKVSGLGFRVEGVELGA